MVNSYCLSILLTEWGDIRGKRSQYTFKLLVDICHERQGLALSSRYIITFDAVYPRISPPLTSRESSSQMVLSNGKSSVEGISSGRFATSAKRWSRWDLFGLRRLIECFPVADTSRMQEIGVGIMLEKYWNQFSRFLQKRVHCHFMTSSKWLRWGWCRFQFSKTSNGWFWSCLLWFLFLLFGNGVRYIFLVDFAE